MRYLGTVENHCKMVKNMANFCGNCKNRGIKSEDWRPLYHL